MTVADSFAEFAAGLRQDAAPGAALHGARRRLVDCCGAAVAGAALGAGTDLRTAALDLAGY